MIYLYGGVYFVLPWTVESFPFVFWRWRNKLKMSPLRAFCSLLVAAGWELAPSL